MSRYRVVGRRYQDFYAHVEAADSGAAYDLAAELPMHKWFELEIDDPIEPIEIDLDEESSSENIQLNIDNDDWPEMDAGIIVGD